MIAKTRRRPVRCTPRTSVRKAAEIAAEDWLKAGLPKGHGLPSPRVTAGQMTLLGERLLVVLRAQQERYARYVEEHPPALAPIHKDAAKDLPPEAISTYHTWLEGVALRREWWRDEAARFELDQIELSDVLLEAIEEAVGTGGEAARRALGALRAGLAPISQAEAHTLLKELISYSTAANPEAQAIYQAIADRAAGRAIRAAVLRDGAGRVVGAVSYRSVGNVLNVGHLGALDGAVPGTGAQLVRELAAIAARAGSDITLVAPLEAQSFFSTLGFTLDAEGGLRLAARAASTLAEGTGPLPGWVRIGWLEGPGRTFGEFTGDVAALEAELAESWEIATANFGQAQAALMNFKNRARQVALENISAEEAASMHLYTLRAKDGSLDAVALVREVAGKPLYGDRFGARPGRTGAGREMMRHLSGLDAAEEGFLLNSTESAEGFYERLGMIKVKERQGWTGAEYFFKPKDARAFASGLTGDTAFSGQISWELAVAGASDWLRAHKIPGVVDEVSETTHKALVDALAYGLERGESTQQLALRIRQLDNVFGPVRAERIARTEVITANRAGGYQMGKDAGCKEHEWRARVESTRTRDWHRGAHKQRVPYGEPYTVLNRKGVPEKLLYPGDSSLGAGPDNLIQCRCSERHLKPGVSDDLTLGLDQHGLADGPAAPGPVVAGTPGAEPVLKHLPGQHDQKTHGRRHGGPREASDIASREDLEAFARLPAKGYTHAVRYDEELTAILAEGIRPGASGQVYASRAPLVRERGAGYVLFDHPGGRESVDYVEPGLSYPQMTFDAVVPPSAITRVVRVVRDKAGHEIREDELAAFILEHPDSPDLNDLPDQYKAWVSLARVRKHHPGGHDHNQLNHGNRSYVIAESAQARAGFKDARDVADDPKRIKRVWMPPQEYLRLCETFQGPIISQDRPTIDDLRRRIRAGKPLTVPWLELNPDGVFFGQDGRHRARAAYEESVSMIPVDMVLLGSDWDSQLDLLERAGVRTVPEPTRVIQKVADAFADAVLDAIAKDKGWAPGPNAGWKREDEAPEAGPWTDAEFTTNSGRKTKMGKVHQGQVIDSKAFHASVLEDNDGIVPIVYDVATDTLNFPNAGRFDADHGNLTGLVHGDAVNPDLAGVRGNLYLTDGQIEWYDLGSQTDTIAEYAQAHPTRVENTIKANLRQATRSLFYVKKPNGRTVKAQHGVTDIAEILGWGVDKRLQVNPKRVQKRLVADFADAVLRVIAKDKGWMPGEDAHWRRRDGTVDKPWVPGSPDKGSRSAKPKATAAPAPTVERPSATETKPSPPTDGQPEFARDVPRFKTKDEAYQWLAKNVGVRAISDDRLSLGELQELADGCHPAVRDFKGQIPAMKIETSGAGGKRSAAWRFDNTLLLNQAYRKNQAKRDADNVLYFRANKRRIVEGLENDIQTRGDPTGKLQSSLDAMNSCTRWSAGMDSAHPIETVYAHEMGHRVCNGDTYWAWETAIRKAGVTRNDRWAVSEYGAESGAEELFAEVHAMVSTGRRAELPKSVSDAYDAWLAATYRRKGRS